MVPSRLLASPESAKDPQPKSPQHTPGRSDDVEAVQVTAHSADAGGSSVANSSTEHNETSDVYRFPIACTLEKHARGFYILSGVCGLCDQTFRAAGGGLRGGKLLPWKGHVKVEDDIVQHARMHGVDGYTPRRNLDKMRLDWVPDASTSRSRKTTTFCIGCAKWKERNHFRCGASTCIPCLQITTETSDVYRFPVACTLEEHAAGFYILFGVCSLCDQTFRATGGKVQGKLRPWNHHATVQDNIVQHARMHGIRGYTPRRNLDEMRLDWVPDASVSKYRKTIAFCTGCATWRRKNHFPCGTGTCITCLPITCTSCGQSKKSTQYRSRDVYGLLQNRRNAPENFTDPDIYRYLYSIGDKHITCLVCKEQQHVRRQRLQNLMKKSRRKDCTCKHPQAHTQTCPLRIKFDGDTPYPGCDVMSRADSDWLLERRNKNGWVRAA